MNLGERLRSAREAQNGDLHQIAAELRIKASYLEAIEAGDASRLPGGFFTRSFVRQYARRLGLEEKNLDAELNALLAGEAVPLLPGEEPDKGGTDLPPLPRYARRRPQQQKVLSAVAVLVLVIAGCAAAYWYLVSSESAPARTVQAPPRPEPVTRAEAAAAKPAAAPAETHAPEGPLWLHLEAEQEVWVEITSGEETLFSGLLRASESKKLTGLEEARLVIGNAGGLRIYWNGKPVGPIGRPGQVRIVKVTPEGAEIKSPRPTSPNQEDGNGPSTGV
jgi:cytoskeletal protein RodZ